MKIQSRGRNIRYAKTASIYTGLVVYTCSKCGNDFYIDLKTREECCIHCVRKRKINAVIEEK